MSFTANSTKGKYRHKLSIDELPSHAHKPHEWSLIISNGGNSGTFGMQSYSNGNVNYFSQDSNQIRTTTFVGGNKAHWNVQPSIVVFFWRRIN